MKRNLLTLTMLCCGIYAVAQHSTIDLAGHWSFNSTPEKPNKEYVTLPGTTDTNRKGERNTQKGETTHLSRLFTYFGEATYSKEIDIPSAWKDKYITLFLERTKPTTVYIDGNEIGKCDDVSVPHVYDLTGKIKPGHHILTIKVDNGNSVPKQLLGSSHAYTEDTQTNWNGIIGKMYLEAKESPVIIKRIRTAPNAARKKVDVEVTLAGNSKKKYSLHFSLRGRVKKGDSIEIAREDYRQKIVNDDGTTTLFYTFSLGDNAMEWSEFTPKNIYRLKVRVECGDKSDERETSFGLCDFKSDITHFIVNGRWTFLRGKHDACVFPLTAHVPMDYDEWYKYLSTCKQYGVNHVRFHSWCPPEACFEAADNLGIYLQPELPIWGGFDEKDEWLTSYLRDEGRKIIDAYGNHPSFVMMGLGNELWGSIELMADYVADFRKHDDIGSGCRRLYTYGSNMYLGFKGVLDGMDYFTTCRIGGEAWGDYNTHVRGSFSFCDAFDGGLINHEYPNTTTNFENAINGSKVPIISHETGQFQTYPNFDEIDKYTGVLRPDNMRIFRQRLKDAGMISQAKDFHKASGRWSVELYKADIEMDLRTKNMAGFQLLDIQDYPGQGSAYVGILDAFMDSKGIVKHERWRQWCNTVVPMAELPRLTYTEGDTISWKNIVANYASSDTLLEGKTMKWAVFRADGSKMSEGASVLKNIRCGVNEISRTSAVAKLSSPEIAEMVKLRISVDGTKFRNSYSMWIYPAHDYAKRKAELAKSIVIADTLDDATIDKLKAGAKVLLMPQKDMYAEQTVGGLVQTDYWNYRMFKTISENNKKPVSPGTLGLLVNDKKHPIFKSFPTETHSNWQWAAITHESRPLVMDRMAEGYRPLIQVIDNVERNHRLGLLFEMSVGKGKVMVCMSDLRNTAQYPESRQLMLSILEYMNGSDFNPAVSLAPDAFKSLFTDKSHESNVKELRNISYD
ncbi:MAG: sugar-binding domain-containing protein [Prevotella sp.]